MLPNWQSGAAALLLSVASLVAWGATAPAKPPEKINAPVIADWRTGLALHGIDPVAYYADGRPWPGMEQFELTWGGATWRFRNEGNQKAFAGDPQVYLPRFGGHDPVGIARGVATPGNPELWLIFGGKVHLFHTAASQDLFRAAPRKVLAAAAAKWPTMAGELRLGDYAPGVSPMPSLPLP